MFSYKEPILASTSFSCSDDFIKSNSRVTNIGNIKVAIKMTTEKTVDTYKENVSKLAYEME
jgi:hypothetical protein